MLFVIIGVVIIAGIAEPNVEYPLPELELRFVKTRELLDWMIQIGTCEWTVDGVVVADGYSFLLCCSVRGVHHVCRRLCREYAGYDQRLSSK